ncbi:MAG: radical SAM protein [Candidatus Latescibacteria bacterium]|jgi:hypothetical protein|nr:radical SAM protein [Candidatus Latescibacterota bacterium]MDP7237222.1 radical SAM protein [Candidatus Latescibacterota bacterium]
MAVIQGSTNPVELGALPVDEVVNRVGVAKAIDIKYVASLLFTYRCTIACKHCLFYCSPRRPDVCVSLDDGVEFMRQLRQTDRVIHIAGGEAMMYYDEMLAVCRASNEIGAAPHFFETNAIWCRDDTEVRDRYEALLDAGIRGVLISADPYHQAFVPPDRRLRAFQLAVEIFGPENIIAGDLSLEELQELQQIGRNAERTSEHSRNHPPQFVGRAGDELARFSLDRPLEDLENDRLWHHDSPGSKGCRSELDPDDMWEIHIDPYGNILTCCGIIIGDARSRPLVEWMEHGFHKDNELVGMARDHGPYAYLSLAKQHGYTPRKEYAQKCHLCWETRKFLRSYFPETFGPAEIYEPI